MMREGFPRLLMAASILLLVVAGVPVGATRLDSRTANASSAELYVIDGPVGERLVPLDPVTLTDHPDGQPIAIGRSLILGADPRETWAMSADGSTQASIEYGEIVIRDGRTGAERLRFFPDASVRFPVLSPDGARLAVKIAYDYSDRNLTPPAWGIFDTTNGRLLTAIEGDGEVDLPFVIDPSFRHLYRLRAEKQGHDALWSFPPSPSSVEIVAHDLGTGAEIGRLPLPEVRSGIWETDRGGEGELVLQELHPALVVSPDGRHVAVVHADTGAVTLVDTSSMSVARTFVPEHPVGLKDRLISLLPLVPQTAAAKEEVADGTFVRATFSPDGQRLYVTGFTWHADVHSFSALIEAQGLGLRIIDITTGEIVAEALPDGLIDQLIPAPDGRSVYVIGPKEGQRLVYGNTLLPERGHVREAPHVLRRLDATTLEVRAKREFSGYRWMLLGAAADGAA